MIQTSNFQKTLNLLFPQWQGSGMTKELYYGAMMIYEGLQDKAKFACVSVPQNQDNSFLPLQTR
jgi:hypothetical protein